MSELDAVADAAADAVAYNREAWDRQVEGGNEWTRPVDAETVARARNGDWSVVLIGYKPAPREWFPADMHGVDLLGLASGGGQQGPIFAAAGANVTIFDNSPAQLARDGEVAEREALEIRTVEGDMRDLSAFEDASFDLVFNPVSNVFCPDLRPVWRECHRVLRPGGTLLAGFMNPDFFVFDHERFEASGDLVVRFSVPYRDTESLRPEELEKRMREGWPLEYSHTMAEQVGGQMEAGFVLRGFDEAWFHDERYPKHFPAYYATRAVKGAAGEK
jgi:SAM-dependent methyltransferase